MRLLDLLGESLHFVRDDLLVLGELLDLSAGSVERNLVAFDVSVQLGELEVDGVDETKEDVDVIDLCIVLLIYEGGVIEPLLRRHLLDLAFSGLKVAHGV